MLFTRYAAYPREWLQRFFVLSFFLAGFVSSAQASDSLLLRKISDDIMLHGTCYEELRVLCKEIGHRLSGTQKSLDAVYWAKDRLKAAGADSVWLQPVEVPHWERGQEELQVSFRPGGSYERIPMLSLGNSEGTAGKALYGEIFLVNSLEELQALSSEEVRGKVVFFNQRFPQELINTFEGYGKTARNRSLAPNHAAAKGAAAVIMRSVSTGLDDIPHTGVMQYADTIRPIPAVAIGNLSADRIEQACRKGTASVKLTSSCTMKKPTLSYNVIAEIKGTVFPEEIVLAGGHLDSWDVGEGAHDDGAGCVQSMEIIRTVKALAIRPKRTIRVVLFMNEENGLKGGNAYADSAFSGQEKHIFAIESDAGGFSPRGISLAMAEHKRRYIQSYAPLFFPYGVYDFEKRYGGADITPLYRSGVPTAGLLPDPQRYFDLHHTAADVFEAVHHRELKLGAVVMTQLVYLVSEHGMPASD